MDFCIFKALKSLNFGHLFLFEVLKVLKKFGSNVIAYCYEIPSYREKGQKSVI